MGNPGERIAVDEISAEPLWTLGIGAKIEHSAGVVDAKTEFSKTIDVGSSYWPGPVAYIGTNTETATSTFACTATAAAKQKRKQNENTE